MPYIDDMWDDEEDLAPFVRGADSRGQPKEIARVGPRTCRTLRDVLAMLSRLDAEGVDLDISWWGYDDGHIYAGDGYKPFLRSVAYGDGE